MERSRGCAVTLVVGDEFGWVERYRDGVGCRDRGVVGRFADGDVVAVAQRQEPQAGDLGVDEPVVGTACLFELRAFEPGVDEPARR